jgi:hypothetical protein
MQFLRNRVSAVRNYNETVKELEGFRNIYGVFLKRIIENN